MSKKISKLNYQIAFEFRKLKWFVLGTVLSSVLVELIYMYIKINKLKKGSEVEFYTLISKGIWEIIFYLTMIVAIIGIGKLIGGDKKGYNGLMTLRLLPLETKDIVISKVIVAVVSVLTVYASQIVSFMIGWLLFIKNIKADNRANHALNTALREDAFIRACIPDSILGLLVNIVVLTLFTTGVVYSFYAVRTRSEKKIIIGAMFFTIYILAIIALVIFRVRIPFIHFVAAVKVSERILEVAITGVVYVALNVVTFINMYKEFENEY